jgi:hypothetical protein
MLGIARLYETTVSYQERCDEDNNTPAAPFWCIAVAADGTRPYRYLLSKSGVD